MYPVDLQVAAPERSSRFWAIPILGLAVKVVILIPHLILLYVLSLVAGLLQFIIWIPVLFTGQYPAWAYQYVGGVLQWNIRISAYYFGLTDRYPPFELASPASWGNGGQALASGASMNALSGQGGRVYTCSRCGATNAAPTNYCPNCGIAMLATSAAPAPTASSPTANPVAATPVTADLPNICAVCQRRLTDEERAFCAAHPDRFHGQVYCAQHQLAPDLGAGLAGTGR